ncbi:hypothetical protein J2X65_003756 [Ancylobacter sp. 3268]|nr:hypothetical protein [Ancylobacter sp. 3268]
MRATKIRGNPAGSHGERNHFLSPPRRTMPSIAHAWIRKGADESGCEADESPHAELRISR